MLAGLSSSTQWQTLADGGWCITLPHTLARLTQLPHSLLDHRRPAHSPLATHAQLTPHINRLRKETDAHERAHTRTHTRTHTHTHTRKPAHTHVTSRSPGTMSSQDNRPASPSPKASGKTFKANKAHHAFTHFKNQ